MTNHLMIDLETLGTAPGSVIKQIGWCVFNPDLADPVIKSGCLDINTQSALDEGLVVDGETLSWWFERPDEARLPMTREGISLRAALIKFKEIFWYQSDSKDIDLVWAKPPHFDIAMLDFAYRKTGIEAPWKHWQIRCLKTLHGQYPDLMKYEPEIPHEAESDAIAQARTAADCLRMKSC